VELLLFTAGGVFALLLNINLFLQFFRHTPKIGFTHMLLAFMVALVSLWAMITNQLRDEPLLLLDRIAIGIALLVIIPGFVGLLLELRRPERLKGSRGVLGIGVGLLVGISSVTVPLIASNTLAAVRATPTPLIVAAADEATEEVETDEPTFTPTTTLTPTWTSTPTATRIQPTLTPTATRFRFSTRTPVPTATLTNPCVALTLYNVNLRAEPDTESDLVATIPFNLSVLLYGRNDDSTWWFGEYEGQSGWLNGEFLTLSASCSDLPERNR
jgi:hypothetical protein